MDEGKKAKWSGCERLYGLSQSHPNCPVDSQIFSATQYSLVQCPISAGAVAPFPIFLLPFINGLFALSLVPDPTNHLPYCLPSARVPALAPSMQGTTCVSPMRPEAGDLRIGNETAGHLE